jgi:hypothetical protein
VMGSLYGSSGVRETGMLVYTCQPALRFDITGLSGLYTLEKRTKTL